MNNKGAECIAKALVQNRTLEELNLNGNRVGLAGLIHIFKALGTNDCLRILRVSFEVIQISLIRIFMRIDTSFSSYDS